jgi:SAM-dependent methyltransferase
MRKTFRSKDNKDYWEERWKSIKTDKVMFNEKIYPLKYAIKATKYNDKSQKILEAGCGAGRILSYLHYKNYNIIGIDFIEAAIKKIKKKDNKIKAKTESILKTSFKNHSFDNILAFGLYHNFEISDLNKAFNETKRILKINGILCFSFRADNLQNLILDKIKNRKTKDQNKKFHKLNLKEKEILDLLHCHNFEVLEKEYVINMPLLFHFKIFRSKEQKKFDEHLARRDGYTLNAFGKIIHKFLLCIFPKQYCNIYVIFCKKK